MRITLKLYGNLKRYSPQKQETAPIEITKGMTITGVLVQLGIPDHLVWMSAVNDVVMDSPTALRDGAVLEVFEPVGGGAR